MPMKLPKSFTRRKSSGNVLEDVGTPQSSFRVLERGAQRSMTDGAALSKHHSEGNAISTDDNMFAGHERPSTMESHKRRLMGNRESGTYESSTSTRLSSSSTNPSSTEVPPEDTHSRFQDVPAPRTNTFRAAAERTFSLSIFKKPSTAARQQTPDPANRPPTGGTDSTATPPKLPDTNFSMESQDDFNKMFDNMGGSSARERSPQPDQVRPVIVFLEHVALTVSKESSPPSTSRLPEFQTSRAAAPAQINTDRSINVEPPPFSWANRPSEEGLLHDRDLLEQNRYMIDIGDSRRPSASPKFLSEPATTSHRSLDRPSRGQSDRAGLRRSGAYTQANPSTFDDEDAKMVRQSLMWSKGTSPWGERATSGGSYIDKGKAPEYRNTDQDPDNNMFLNRRSPAPATRQDPLASDARLAARLKQSLPKSASPGNKVMTPSQFEHYRQQQELQRSNSTVSKSDAASDDDEFDDEEDEVEKQREAEKQRRKQEAHLSVYRQQMTKITGQQAPLHFQRPIMSRSTNSTPNLLPSRLSVMGDKSTSDKSSEDEDDDIPLGILAAHGFPGQNRPPTRLSNFSSNPNLHASMQPPYISSSSSVSGGDNSGRLPPFAKNLPQDPYYGAGLVNNTNRESLAFGGGSGSVHGGSSSPAPTPGGLVGVIANEERQRAMRRGSPNTQAMQSTSGVPRPYSMMPQIPTAVQPTMGEQASINLSQEMTKMMQMQMQWMQQMMQLQGVPGSQSMMQNMPMPQMNSPLMPNGRPMSVPVGSMLNAPYSPPQTDQHTLGVLDPPGLNRRTASPMPNLSGNAYRPQTSYAPSIAPSERSNSGMAPRYRPVSVMPPGFSPPGDENQHPAMLNVQYTPDLPKSHLASVTARPVSQNSRLGTGLRQKARSDDDDDEAWAEMIKKRDEKKANWKSKREDSSFGDLLSVVH